MAICGIPSDFLQLAFGLAVIGIRGLFVRHLTREPAWRITRTYPPFCKALTSAPPCKFCASAVPANNIIAAANDHHHAHHARQFPAEVTGCKMLATQDAKTEILVETVNCPDLGGCRWPMTRRLWTGEAS